MHAPSLSDEKTPTKTRRLFVGIPVLPEGELKQALGNALKKMRISADRHRFELNWVPPANFHVTLNFLGATDEKRLSEITNALESAASQTAPFCTDLRGVGAFPDDRHMRTLWIGVRLARSLATLQENLCSELEQRGFKKDERTYRPHLTVAKTRKARNAGDLISPFVRANFGEVKVERVILYESLQHGPHTSFEILSHVPLSGACASAPAGTHNGLEGMPNFDK